MFVDSEAEKGWQTVCGDGACGCRSRPSHSDHKDVSSFCTGRIFGLAIAFRQGRTAMSKVS